MATLSVTVTRDYSADTLDGIDLIDFDNPLLTLAVATFLVSQFDGAQIEFGAEIRGSAGKNGIVLIGQYVDANEFFITNWGSGDSLTLQGTGVSDYLAGSPLNETLNGGGGNDTLVGGSGSDSLNGFDTFNGGAGNDSIEAEYDLEGDVIDGGTGNDTLHYQSISGSYDLSIDISDGGGGRDIGNGTTLSNIEVAEIIFFSNGTVDFTGGGGADAVVSGSSADTLNGGAGDDFLKAGGGKDEISGGAGDDTLVGGSGGDTLIGGTGEDIFYYERVSDSSARAGDLIRGFVTRQDEIDLSSIDANSTNRPTPNNPDGDAFIFIDSDPFSGIAGELRVTRSREPSG